jgi:hypothetical protein
MTNTRFVSLAGSLLLALGMAGGCKKAADLAKGKDAAALVEMAKSKGPEVAKLAETLKGLTGRADAIPDSVPGATKVKDLIKQHAGKLDSLKSLLGGVDGQVATAAKSGKPTELAALSTKVTTDVTTSITELTTGLAAAETELAAVEAAAKAPPPAADGSGSGSAAPAADGSGSAAPAADGSAAPAADAPKTDAPAADAPKADAPKADATPRRPPSRFRASRSTRVARGGARWRFRPRAGKLRRHAVGDFRPLVAALRRGRAHAAASGRAPGSARAWPARLSAWA